MRIRFEGYILYLLKVSNENPKKLVFWKQISLLLFFLGYSGILFSLFFCHTRGLWYASDFLLLIALLLRCREIKSLFFGNYRMLFLLIAFLCFLLLAVMYSPDIFASLDAFFAKLFF